MGVQRYVLAAAAFLGLLAACSPAGQPGASPQSAEEAQREVAQATLQMETGQWRTTITVLEAEMPGVPAEIAQSMMGQPIVVEECRTSEDPEVATESWLEAEEGCQAGSFTFTGNRFEGSQTCTEEGVTMTMSYSGTLTPTRMEGQSEMSGQTPAGPMRQRATIVSERIGACAG